MLEKNWPHCRMRRWTRRHEHFMRRNLGQRGLISTILASFGNSSRHSHKYLQRALPVLGTNCWIAHSLRKKWWFVCIIWRSWLFFNLNIVFYFEVVSESRRGWSSKVVAILQAYLGLHFSRNAPTESWFNLMGEKRIFALNCIDRHQWSYMPLYNSFP